MRSTALQSGPMLAAENRGEPRTYTLCNKYVIYLLRNIYGFHTIYNHFYIRCGCSALKCVYYKWSGLVPNARDNSIIMSAFVYFVH